MIETLQKRVAAHLAYLGYEVKPPQPDGWALAVHPVRLDFVFRAFEIGLRLHCVLFLGKQADEEAWRHFLNRANDSSVLSRFALVRDEDGDFAVRVRTLLPGAYDRRRFGLLLDAWQEDVALLRGGPAPASDDEDAADDAEEEKPAVLVN